MASPDARRPVRAQPRTIGQRTPRLTFEQYSEKFAEYFEMERRGGVIQIAHRNGDGWYTVWEQAWHDIGNDPENKVAIITNVGESWIDAPAAWAGETDALGNGWYDVYDGVIRNLEGLIFTMSMPTIGVVGGPGAPGAHIEMALVSDITLCSEDTVFRDIHSDIGAAPGDGTFFAFQMLMGPKRAAYYALTGDGVTAAQALEYGLVTEVLPKGELLPRAWEIADRIAALPRLGRRMTTQIIRRPWQRRFVEDMGFHIAHETFGLAVDGIAGEAATEEQWRRSYERARAMNEAATEERS